MKQVYFLLPLLSLFLSIPPVPNMLVPSASAENLSVTKDVAYASGPSNQRRKLDVYAPGGAQNAPVLIFVHGGGWRKGNKDQSAYTRLARKIAENGVVAVVPNYRLSGMAKFPAPMQDLAAAVAWTFRNIRDYGGSPDDIFIAGHSAGGHLACLLALDPGFLRAEGIPLTAIKGVLALSAIYDIHLMGPNARRTMAEPEFGDSPAVWRQASPITHVRGGLPPFLVLYAQRDTETLRNQAETFATALRKQGVQVEVVKLKGHGHLSEILRRNSPLVPPILAFIKQISGSHPTPPAE